MIHQPVRAMNAAQTGFRSLPGAASRGYFYHAAAGIGPDAPVIVSVHGISMNAAEHMLRLREVAKVNGAVVLAPHFARKTFPRYQQLQDRQSGVRADLALIEMIADLRTRFALAPERIHLTGFSGGAQFAHRFALYHAGMVAACVSCAAGWYSFPDASQAFPLGIAAGSGPGGLSLHPDWLKVPHTVVVGTRDTAVEDALNMGAPVVAMQGTGRRERARRWVEAMDHQRAGAGLPGIDFKLIRGLSHDFTRAHERHGLADIIATAMGLVAPEGELDA